MSNMSEEKNLVQQQSVELEFTELPDSEMEQISGGTGYYPGYGGSSYYGGSYSGSSSSSYSGSYYGGSYGCYY